MTDAERSDKLKDCPFCGGEAVIQTKVGERWGVPFVECRDCNTRTSLEGTVEDAIAAWNRRPESVCVGCKLQEQKTEVKRLWEVATEARTFIQKLRKEMLSDVLVRDTLKRIDRQVLDDLLEKSKFAVLTTPTKEEG